MKSIFSVSHKLLTALVSCAALLLTGVSAFAQTTSGKVLDTNGVPVIGAAVMVPGTTNGAVTDIDGNFELRVAPGTMLEVSCIGYTTKTVAAAANMTVTLEEDAEMLEETIVIGYGSVKRSDLTSAVAKMDNKGIEDRPMARAEQALQGQLAGVSVRITNSEPGADPEIRVRGAASISAGNNPLYVIDGVPQSSMTGINPNDIASIEVLKDAASSAIYGSRGSNGVVIVTTKTGAKGKPKVTYTGTIGLSTLEKKMDVFSATEWQDPQARRRTRAHGIQRRRSDEVCQAGTPARTLSRGCLLVRHGPLRRLDGDYAQEAHHLPEPGLDQHLHHQRQGRPLPAADPDAGDQRRPRTLYPESGLVVLFPLFLKNAPNPFRCVFINKSKIYINNRVIYTDI